MNPVTPDETSNREKSACAWLRIFVSDGGADWISETLQTHAPIQDLNVETSSVAHGGCATWLHKSTLPDSADIEDHVGSLLQFLESKRLAWDVIRDRAATVDIFCRYSAKYGQGSAEFSTYLLSRLAELKIGLVIELCEHPAE